MDVMCISFVLAILGKIMTAENGIVAGRQTISVQSLRPKSHILYREVEILADILRVCSLQLSAISHCIVVEKCGGWSFHIVIVDLIVSFDVERFVFWKEI